MSPVVVGATTTGIGALSPAREVALSLAARR
jgi:hypothetical protein